MNTCYIVGASHFKCEIQPDESDLIIAADGGYDRLREMGITPHILIGDFDSISSVPEDSNIEVITHKREKDETDLYLCYMHAVKRKYKQIVILGATGGRPDHTFANYSLLLCMKERDVDAVITDGEYEIRVIKNEEIVLHGTPGKLLSVFAFGNNARGVDIVGAKYTLNNAMLSCAYPLGVSNEFESEFVYISVKDGALLLIQQI